MLPTESIGSIQTNKDVQGTVAVTLIVKQSTESFIPFFYFCFFSLLFSLPSSLNLEQEPQGRRGLMLTVKGTYKGTNHILLLPLY